MDNKLLAQEIGKLVEEYFYDRGTGHCEPTISFNQYDIKKYTFRMSCQTYNRSAQYCCNDKMDVDSFRREVRLLLKHNGYRKVKFDTQKLTIVGGAFGDYTVTELKAIYFDV